MTSEIVAVTQKDREAAAYLIYRRDNAHAFAHEVRQGRADNSLTVQAFARHRLAAAPIQLGCDPVVREALEQILALEITPIQHPECGVRNGKELIRARAIARAALSQSITIDGEG